MSCTCLAIAQTKPANSRAIAAVISVGSFPARASRRYRRHSRSCAFHAMSRLGQALLAQQLLAADPCGMECRESRHRTRVLIVAEQVAPGGLDKHAPCRAVASLCYTALAPRAAAVLGRHQTEIGHELAWIDEARDVAEFGNQRCRNHQRHATQRLQRLQRVRHRGERPVR